MSPQFVHIWHSNKQQTMSDGLYIEFYFSLNSFFFKFKPWEVVIEIGFHSRQSIDSSLNFLRNLRHFMHLQVSPKLTTKRTHHHVNGYLYNSSYQPRFSCKVATPYTWQLSRTRVNYYSLVPRTYDSASFSLALPCYLLLCVEYLKLAA